MKVPKTQLPGKLLIEALFDSGPLQGKFAHTLPIEVSAGPR